MSTLPPPRFPITEAEIDLVVARFYARVRRHPVLGPVFARHVHDWPVHEARIARFWKGAILFQPGFDGSPMMAHRRAGDVRPDHFPDWLGLFDETLHEVLAPEQAAGWSALAHRIGSGLRQGVADIGRGPGAAPSLR